MLQISLFAYKRATSNGGCFQQPYESDRESGVMRKRVLFLCTGNSCRSQIAEGWLRVLNGEEYTIFSAGTCPSPIKPLAIKVMDEVGLDISRHSSDDIDQYADEPLDEVITAYDRAQGSCPIFRGKTAVINWSFDDPADAEGSDEERMVVFRRVRDEIKSAIEEYLTSAS